MKKIVALMLVLMMVGSAALAEVCVLTTANPTYVRSSPMIAENIIDQLPPNYLYTWGGHVSVDTRGVEWYDIYYDGYKYGWISGLHGNLVDSATGQTWVDHSTYRGNDTTIYATQGVSVYTGAGYGYATIGYMYAGDTADYTGFSQKDSNGNLWYQINYYNSTGWVPAQYTSIR